MCLITKKKTPRVAKKDIPVWKILNGDGSRAPYFNFKYVKGKTYKTEFTYVDNSIVTTLFKLDGYKPFNHRVRNYLSENYDGWANPNHPVRDKLICVAEGFHGFTKKKEAISYLSKDRMIVKFMIPEGAEYIKDENDLIVSNQIKML